MEKAEVLQTIIASKFFFKKSIICGDITFEIIPYILHNHPIFPPLCTKTSPLPPLLMREIRQNDSGFNWQDEKLKLMSSENKIKERSKIH